MTTIKTNSTDFVEQLEDFQQVSDSRVVSYQQAIFQHEGEGIFEYQDVLL